MNECEDVNGAAAASSATVAASSSSAIAVAAPSPSPTTCGHRIRTELSIASVSDAECGICLVEYSLTKPDAAAATDHRPHLLECGNNHHVCAESARRLMEQKDASCPQCRQPVLSHELHVELMFNLKQSQLDGSSSIGTSTSKTMGMKCSTFKEESCTAVSTHYCHECKLDYCHEHATAVHELMDNESHEVVTVDKKADLLQRNGVCAIHLHDMDMYCGQCKAVCCRYCIDVHFAHQSLGRADEAAGKVKEKLRARKKRLKQIEDAADDGRDALKRAVEGHVKA